MNMEARIFFDSFLPHALRGAVKYAGDKGYVASLPQLLNARANAPYDNLIWNTWFNPNSEESLINTPQGNRVVVTVHGGGIFGTPNRFENLYRASTDRRCEIGFTGLFAGKITPEEANGVSNGRMPDGAEIPVYPFDEFAKGVGDLPRRYAVVTDFETAKSSCCGYAGYAELKADPMVIVRAGGVDAAAKYLDAHETRNNTDKMASWHPFHIVDTPDQNQTRIPSLSGNKGGAGSDVEDSHLYGYDSDYGIGGDGSFHTTSMINVARYVAVAPQLPENDVRHLPFNA